ncbi:MAG: prolyl oligopeptidase family serine peptidase [Spirosomataceae bacterium]
MKKQILTGILCLLTIFTFGQNPSSWQRAENFLKKDSITSSLDGYTQHFYYVKTNHSKPQPLVVELHSWSNTVDSQKEILGDEASAKNWNYILPNFRGVNNHTKACCSAFVISDIDEAIDWALKNMNIDPKRIYVAGVSGGGYATLAMFMKSRHKIASFSAWASISDLTTWYSESVERKNKYAAEILQCIGANDTLDEQKAQERSPLFWNTPLRKRKKSLLQIYAGIHDGYTGSVPISHSIRFYNKLLTDANEKDLTKYVSKDDASVMLKTQTFSTPSTPKMLGDRAILYQKSAKNITLTIFEGTHEILNKVVLEIITPSIKP